MGKLSNRDRGIFFDVRTSYGKIGNKNFSLAELSRNSDMMGGGVFFVLCVCLVFFFLASFEQDGSKKITSPHTHTHDEDVMIVTFRTGRFRCSAERRALIPNEL